MRIKDGMRPAGVAFGLTMLGIPVVLAFVARRNTRLGRGDRRGATRVAGFCFVGIVISGAFQRHWSSDPSLLGLGLVITLLFPLFAATLAWVSYVGVEPYVRRRWPALLIGWTRLLDGRAGDGRTLYFLRQSAESDIFMIELEPGRLQNGVG